MNNFETIKNNIYKVKYLIPDTLPLKGLKRMQYYVCHPKDPSKFCLGLSFRTKYDRDMLKGLAKEGKLIELIESIDMPFDMDIWLNPEGQVVLAKGYSSSDAKNLEYVVVASPAELAKINQIFKRTIKKQDLPNIPRAFKIV
jgi:hypothetical protein